MKDKNFVTEIERMSAEHFGYEYPTDFVSHAQNLEKRIENKESPSNIRYAFFKVTMRCNSDCAYCEHAYSKNQGNLTERSLEEISRVIKELAEMGVKACSVSGGEPLTYKGIENIIKAMVSNKIEPILLTNGILLPQKLQKIYDAGQRYIIISIDSFNPEHYRENRGIDFDSLMRAYNYALDFRRTHPDLVLNITSVLSKNNQGDIVSLIERASADGVNVQLTPYHNFVNGDKPLDVVDISELDAVIGQVLKMKDEGYLILNSREYLEYFSTFFATGERIPRDVYKCKCGYDCVYIWPDLTVRSCWSTSLPVVGDLNKMSLKEIWNSERYSAQRKKMLECRCEGCWLLCTAEFNIIRNQKLLEGKE